MLTLRIRGNTSVRAVFERIMCRVRIASGVEGARVLINSSAVDLPYELVVPWGTLLVIEPLPPEGYEPSCWLINGSRACAITLRLRVKGNLLVEASFRRSRG